MITIDGVLDRLTNEVVTILRDMDENYNIIVTGMPGKGKSGTAQAIAKRIDPTFTADHVVFTNKELLVLLASKPKRYWRGKCIVYDEAGIDRSAQESQSRINKAMNKVMQSYRYLNVCMIYTASFRSFVLKNDRKLFHAEIKIFYKDIVKKEVHAKWYYLKYSERLEKVLTPFPKMIINGYPVVIKFVYIPHPPMDIWKAYLKRERPYKKHVQEEAMKVIDHEQMPKQTQKGMQANTEKQINDILKQISKKPDIMRGQRGAFDIEKIMVKYKVGRRLSKKIKAAAELEGL